MVERWRDITRRYLNLWNTTPVLRLDECMYVSSFITLFDISVEAGVESHGTERFAIQLSRFPVASKGTISVLLGHF
jgi:hypothetical protein